jgi:hypothetical protein
LGFLSNTSTNFSLDILFDAGDKLKFSTNGPNSINLIGYYIIDEEDEEEEGEEDEIDLNRFADLSYHSIYQ